MDLAGTPHPNVMSLLGLVTAPLRLHSGFLLSRGSYRLDPNVRFTWRTSRTFHPVNVPSRFRDIPLPAGRK